MTQTEVQSAPIEAAPGLAATTMCEAFAATAAAFADRVALRAADGSQTLTWAQYAERVARIAGGMSARLGVQAGDTIALMTTNRPEFHLCDTAAIHLRATPFSLYNTLSSEQIAYVLANSGARVVFLEAQFLDVVRGALPGTAVEYLVCIDGVAEGTIALGEVEAASRPDFDLVAAGRAVQPDDILTLIYTSGTTGPPKGVQTTHANMVAQIQGAAQVLPIPVGGRAISYLPLAHIADRWAHHYNGMVFGLEIITLPDMRQLAPTLPTAQPTFFGCVPRVLEKMKSALEARIDSQPDEARLATRRAIEVGGEVAALRQARSAVPEDLRLEHESLDAQILSKLRAALGLAGVESVIVGAAPIPPAVYDFFTALGFPITNIYGMSEASCLMAAAPPSEARPGTVGRALPNIDLRLAEDGEILCRGPIVMKGYRNDPERTAEAIDEEGWLHTGDIGAIDDDGFLRIVDRKKELIINAGGKNMSPANIETTIKSTSPLIGQAVVIGDGRAYNTALITLDPEYAAAFAEKKGLEPHSSAFIDEARAELDAAVDAANAKLSRVEQIKKFTLLDSEWLPGGDELTPTMKIKRRPIAEKYSKQIEAMYADRADGA
jgi:long-chain acyl-CoA synthetase